MGNLTDVISSLKVTDVAGPMIRLILMDSAFSCWWNAGLGLTPKPWLVPNHMARLYQETAVLLIYSDAHRNQLQSCYLGIKTEPRNQLCQDQSNWNDYFNENNQNGEPLCQFSGCITSLKSLGLWHGDRGSQVDQWSHWTAQTCMRIWYLIVCQPWHFTRKQ